LYGYLIRVAPLTMLLRNRAEDVRLLTEALTRRCLEETG
jgi:DNA-binding NtrC family response regulator